MSLWKPIVSAGALLLAIGTSQGQSVRPVRMDEDAAPGQRALASEATREPAGAPVRVQRGVEWVLDRPGSLRKRANPPAGRSAADGWGRHRKLRRYGK